MKRGILVSRTPKIAAMTACGPFAVAPLQLVISMVPTIHGPDFEGARCVNMV